jgi:hypothetical protein
MILGITLVNLKISTPPHPKTRTKFGSIIRPHEFELVFWNSIFFTGEEIAFYFAWMAYFRWALCIPSVFGIFVYFWRNPGITVDDNFLLPLYALFMVVWAVFFIVVGLISTVYNTSVRYNTDAKTRLFSGKIVTINPFTLLLFLRLISSFDRCDVSRL